MFTGLIEECGTVLSISANTLTIQAKTILDGTTKLGDSIAVNGVCLTVTKLEKTHFTADVMPETLKRSSLGKLHVGSTVNLERAMAVQRRFGGHIVSGHIDGTGKIVSVSTDNNAKIYTVQTNLAKEMIEKGSVAIDGISLTIIDAYADCFSVGIIPHTAGETTLSEKNVGDIVNLETDVIGKYVKHFLEQQKNEKSTNITYAFLKENGF